MIHFATEVAPTVEDQLPGAHKIQDVAPEIDDQVPLKQEVHEEDNEAPAIVPNDPALQLMQATDADAPD